MDYRKYTRSYKRARARAHLLTSKLHCKITRVYMLRNRLRRNCRLSNCENSISIRVAKIIRCALHNMRAHSLLLSLRFLHLDEFRNRDNLSNSIRQPASARDGTHTARAIFDSNSNAVASQMDFHEAVIINDSNGQSRIIVIKREVFGYLVLD